MAPIALDEPTINNANANVLDLKRKVVVDHVELESGPKAPVADNYMYDFKYNHELPTSDVLGVEVPIDCDVQAEAQGLVARLSDAMGSADAQAFADLFWDYGEHHRLASAALLNLC